MEKKREKKKSCAIEHAPFNATKRRPIKFQFHFRVRTETCFGTSVFASEKTQTSIELTAVERNYFIFHAVKWNEQSLDASKFQNFPFFEILFFISRNRQRGGQVAAATRAQWPFIPPWRAVEEIWNIFPRKLLHHSPKRNWEFSPTFRTLRAPPHCSSQLERDHIG